MGYQSKACTGYRHVRIQYRNWKMSCEAKGPHEPQKERKWTCFTTLKSQGSCVKSIIRGKPCQLVTTRTHSDTRNGNQLPNQCSGHRCSNRDFREFYRNLDTAIMGLQKAYDTVQHPPPVYE